MPSRLPVQAVVSRRRWLLFWSLFAAVAGAYWRLTLLSSLGLGLFGLLLLLAGWLHVARRGLQIERHAQVVRVRVQEPFALQTVLRNRSWLPIPWAEAELRLPSAWRLVEGSAWRAGAHLAPGAEQLVTQQVVSLQRGRHELPPVVGRTGDLLGLAEISLPFAGTDAVLVWPHVQPLTEDPPPATQPLGAQRVQQRAYEDFASLREVREYRPGDPPRRIHWRSTARTGRLKVREFDETATRQWLILPDLNLTAYGSFMPELPLETAISVAASLACQGLGEGQPVGLYAVGQRDALLPPTRGMRQIQLILDRLALAQPVPGLPLDQVVRVLLPLLPALTAVCLVTAAFGVELQQAVAMLRRRRLAVEVWLIDTPASRPHLLEVRAGLAAMRVALHVVTGGPLQWEVAKGE